MRKNNEEELWQKVSISVGNSISSPTLEPQIPFPGPTNITVSVYSVACTVKISVGVRVLNSSVTGLDLSQKPKGVQDMALIKRVTE